MTPVSDAGYVLFLFIALALGGWITRAQDDYLRAYNRATGSNAPTTSDLGRLIIRPWRLWTSAPLTNLARATGTRQSDPSLELLRQRYLQRRLVAFVAIFISFFGWSFLRSAHL
jgi:hypothetical protein